MTADMELSLADRLTRIETAVDENAPGDHLVLDLMSGHYFGVGEVGGFIWEALTGEKSLGEIAAATAAHFQVERERAEGDVLEFATQLLEHDLAKRAGTG